MGNFAFLVTWSENSLQVTQPLPKKCPHWLSIYLGTLLVCHDSSWLSVSATDFRHTKCRVLRDLGFSLGVSPAESTTSLLGFFSPFWEQKSTFQTNPNS